MLPCTGLAALAALSLDQLKDPMRGVVLLAGEMVMLCDEGFNTCLKWFKDGSRDELLFIKWELHRRPPFNGAG
jgi:hypothetical protein